MSDTEKKHPKIRNRKTRPYAMENGQQPILVTAVSGETVSCMNYKQMKRFRKQQRRLRQLQNKAVRHHVKETIRKTELG
jgi:hypothetical protein